jgi:hypothetical protein
VCDKHLPITKNSSGLFYTGLNSAPVEGPVCVLYGEDTLWLANIQECVNLSRLKRPDAIQAMKGAKMGISEVKIMVIFKFYAVLGYYFTKIPLHEIEIFS